ncbi:MAG: polysaccharide deacetylase family protein [Winogradskyella sp.]|nr:polysaccharide deacetylase family protein [Winogradskyella sp.]
MKIIPAKTPGFVRSLFPNYLWKVDTSKKHLYLTFDDGPTEGITEWVLDTLDQYNAKATFFCIGSNIEKHPEIFQKLLKNKHTVGNHTYSHLKGWQTSTKVYVADIQFTDSIIKFQIQNATNTSTDLATQSYTSLFRPPYGKFKSKQSKILLEQGYKMVMWDVLSYDWDTNLSKKKCYKNVISSASKGSIIVFHDSIKASKNLKYTLPKVLEYYSEKGYKFKALDY